MDVTLTASESLVLTVLKTFLKDHLATGSVSLFELVLGRHYAHLPTRELDRFVVPLYVYNCFLEWSPDYALLLPY
jgi:hypothetical protein